MKKFVVFKKEESGYGTDKRFYYSSENIDGFLFLNGQPTGVSFVDYKLDNSTHFSYLEVPPHAYHFELQGDLDPDVVYPVEVSASTLPASSVSGGIESNREGYIYILQENQDKILAKEQKLVQEQIEEAHTQMNIDVYAEMYNVFGTKNPESATAYHDTWKLMAASPTDWSNAGLSARFTRGGVSAGDLLDTDQKVKDYADACLSEVKTYGVWRMQRIEQFKTERETILNS